MTKNEAEELAAALVLVAEQVGVKLDPAPFFSENLTLAKAIESYMGAREDSCARPAVTPELFYVQDSRTYVGNSVVWRCPSGAGYTTHIDRAGKYTRKEIEKMRETDTPWPVEEVDRCWSKHVDIQDLRSKVSEKQRKQT